MEKIVSTTGLHPWLGVLLLQRTLFQNTIISFVSNTALYMFGNKQCNVSIFYIFLKIKSAVLGGKLYIAL
jgi:hypothetical protein